MAAFFLPLRIHYCNIFIGVGLFFWLASWQKEHFSNSPEVRKAFLIFISLYLIQIVGVLYSENLSQAFFLLETKLSLLIFPVMILLSPIKKEDIYLIFKFLLASVLIACLWCHTVVFNEIISSDLPLSSLLTDYHFHNVFFTNPIRLHPAYLTLTISISIFYLIEIEFLKSKNKVLLIVWFLYYAICLITLMSRAGLIAFGFALFVYIIFRIWYLEKKYKTGIVICVVFITMVVLSVVYIPNFKIRMIDSMQNLESRVQDNEDESSPGLHVKQWYCAWNSLHGMHWIWGLGTGDEEDALMKCYSAHNWSGLVAMKLDAHNEYLSSMVRHGLIGLFLFLLNLFYAVYLSIRNRDALYLSFIIMIAINALAASILFGQVSIVIYTLFNALLAKRIFIKQSPKSSINE
jgi:hypothetical protein